jgi:hypothetical protein
MTEAATRPCTCDALADRLQRATFDVAPDAGGGWEAWRVALARLIGRLGGGPTHCVVVTQDPNQRYVQFMLGHGRVHAEVSSNHYLVGDFRLSATEERRLRALGFDIDPDDDHDDRFPHNWQRHSDLRGPGDASTTAAVMSHAVEVIALFDERHPVRVDVFGADAPCEACTWGHHPET